jgi:hypothetical protein
MPPMVATLGHTSEVALLFNSPLPIAASTTACRGYNVFRAKIVRELERQVGFASARVDRITSASSLRPTAIVAWPMMSKP